MEKSLLEPLIEQGFSGRRIGKELGVTLSTIRHWLKKYDLTTKTKQYNRTDGYGCACGEHDPTKFYGHKKQICAKCQNEYNTAKAREAKLFAVEYLGGKCLHCGYNKCIAALDIHHTQPGIKDPKFSNAMFWSRNRLEAELKTCVLLCRNCHAEEHHMK